MRESEHNLKKLTKCPLCKAKYNHSQAFVLEDNLDRTVFHMTCEKCKSAILAFITESKQGIVSVGIATDLSGQEVKSFLNKKPVDQEDVLRIYKYLNNK